MYICTLSAEGVSRQGIFLGRKALFCLFCLYEFIFYLFAVHLFTFTKGRIRLCVVLVRDRVTGINNNYYTRTSTDGSSIKGQERQSIGCPSFLRVALEFFLEKWSFLTLITTVQ